MIKSVKAYTTEDGFNRRLLEAERRHWFSVIQGIISVIKYLWRQSLAFRGSSDALYEHNNGIFLKPLKSLRVLML